jgi:hypothetical protein
LISPHGIEIKHQGKMISRVGETRRRLTSKQRQRLLATFHQSQLAQREFTNQHAIGMSTLANGCGWNATPFPPW